MIQLTCSCLNTKRSNSGGWVPERKDEQVFRNEQTSTGYEGLTKHLSESR